MLPNSRDFPLAGTTSPVLSLLAEYTRGAGKSSNSATPEPEKPEFFDLYHGTFS